MAAGNTCDTMARLRVPASTTAMASSTPRVSFSKWRLIIAVVVASVMVCHVGAASTTTSSRRSDSCSISSDYFLHHSSSIVDGSHVFLSTEILASQANGLTRHPVCKPGPTCCSEAGEEKLPVLARQSLKEVLTNVSRPLVDELKKAQVSLENVISEAVATAERSTAALLNQYYADHSNLTEAAAKKLFSDLRQELTSTSTSTPQAMASAIETAVETFFDDIFPIVYIKMDTSKELTPGYNACLKKERRNITPFGPTPAVQAQVFVQAAQTVRALRDGMQEAIGAVVRASEEPKGRACEVGVARLTMCPICAGYEPWSGQHRACGDFCMNVLRGCMAPWTELEQSWIHLIDAFASFVTVASNSDKGFLSGGSSGSSSSATDDEPGARADEEIRMARIDPQAALRDFDLKVAKAVHTAMQQGVQMQEKIKGKCGKVDKRKKRSPMTLSAPVTTITSYRRRVRRMSGESSRLADDLDKLSVMLSRRRAFFSTLADEVCGELGARAKENCWNGEDMGKYSSPVVEITPSAQKSNPEMTGLDMTAALTIVANVSAKLDQAANTISRDKYLSSSSSGIASRSLSASPSQNSAIQPSDGSSKDSKFDGSNPFDQRLHNQDTFVDGEGGSGSGAGPRLDGTDEEFTFPQGGMGPGVDDEDRYAWPDGGNGGDQGSGSGEPPATGRDGDGAVVEGDRRQPQWNPWPSTDPPDFKFETHPDDKVDTTRRKGGATKTPSSTGANVKAQLSLFHAILASIVITVYLIRS